MAPESTIRTEICLDEICPGDTTRIEIGLATTNTDATSNNSTRSDLVSIIHTDLDVHTMHFFNHIYFSKADDFSS